MNKEIVTYSKNGSHCRDSEVGGEKELLKEANSPKLTGSRKRGSRWEGTKKTMMRSYGEGLHEFRSAPGALAQKKLSIQKVTGSNSDCNSSG